MLLISRDLAIPAGEQGCFEFAELYTQMRYNPIVFSYFLTSTVVFEKSTDSLLNLIIFRSLPIFFRFLFCFLL